MSTDVTLPSDNRPTTLAQMIPSMEHQFALAAPRGVEASQIVRDALTCLRQTPKLAECDPQSVLGSLMTMAQLGLRPGVLGHGWILPFWDNKTRGHKAQLVLGYQGLVELAYRSGQIAKITARTVHENDHFNLEYGIDERLTHRPASGERGKPTGYYATVKIKGGESTFYYMSHDEMCVYRDRFATAKSKDGKVFGPWKDNFEAMAKKTCVRQLSKLMPKSTDLAIGLSVDDTVRLDITPNADPVHVSEHVEPEQIPSTAHVTAEEYADPPEGADLFERGE